jgi:hypothetical protein
MDVRANSVWVSSAGCEGGNGPTQPRRSAHSVRIAHAAAPCRTCPPPLPPPRRAQSSGRKAAPYDPARTLRMLGFGLLWYGPYQFYWYNLLDWAMPARSTANFVAKVRAGQGGGLRRRFKAPRPARRPRQAQSCAPRTRAPPAARALAATHPA